MPTNENPTYCAKMVGPSQATPTVAANSGTASQMETR